MPKRDEEGVENLQGLHSHDASVGADLLHEVQKAGSA